jgi:hypothetical protein
MLRWKEATDNDEESDRHSSEQTDRQQATDQDVPLPDLGRRDHEWQTVSEGRRNVQGESTP